MNIELHKTVPATGSPFEKPKPGFKLDLAHYSMEWSDPKEQTVRDAHKMFDRNYDWITGTEAGEWSVRSSLRNAARRSGYTFNVYKSNWIAVRRSIIVPGTFRNRAFTIMPTGRTAGAGHDGTLICNKFDIKDVGRINVLGTHLATRGRPDGNRDYRVNLDENREMMAFINRIADKRAKGHALVFFGGDMNIVDRNNDVFFGGNLVSAWDELKKWEDTGHDNIDVIARHRGDTRVHPKYVRALDDKEMHMFTDHYPVEAGYMVDYLAS